MENKNPAPTDNHMAHIAAAIGEPVRARMLCCLMDGHARTATELAAVGGISASTASTHLAKLKNLGLMDAFAQGKHRYFQLAGPDVSRALEALLVVAGTPQATFAPSTPDRLRAARTCYDHMAGELAVALHDHMLARQWLQKSPEAYTLSDTGEASLQRWGLDTAAARQTRRRFACPCMDWSERRPHLAGALGAALLKLALQRNWVQQDLDARALQLTKGGHAAFTGFGVTLPSQP
ncbi:MAG: helix-turn-helix transcriptional regulator [Pseudomonadota bacterium]